MYGEVMHIRVEHSGHLGLLDRADLAFGMHDKDRDILLPAQAIDGSRSSVATCGTNHSQVLSSSADTASAFAGISPHKEVLEQVAEELQCNVLEGEGWAVKQFQ